MKIYEVYLNDEDYDNPATILGRYLSEKKSQEIADEFNKKEKARVDEINAKNKCLKCKFRKSIPLEEYEELEAKKKLPKCLELDKENLNDKSWSFFPVSMCSMGIEKDRKYFEDLETKRLNAEKEARENPRWVCRCLYAKPKETVDCEAKVRELEVEE